MGVLAARGVGYNRVAMARENAVKSIESVLDDLGMAGDALVQLGACEGAAGNLSVYLSEITQLPPQFSETETYRLPFDVPELRFGWFVVSGSATRMRDIRKSPLGCLGLLSIGADGKVATLHYSPARQFARITSEFNSHLAVHRSTVLQKGLSYHAIVHAQPRKLTYLSHLPKYQDASTMTRCLLRWQPEGILNFPEGLGVVPFLVPGQSELMAATERALSKHRLVVWSKHGVMARSAFSAQAAVDLIEYAEAAADYEYLNEVAGARATGLTDAEIASVATAYGLDQQVF